MSKQTEALKLALEALEGLEALLLSMGLTHLIVYGDAEKAITALREALAEQPAQPQQEPVLRRIMQRLADLLDEDHFAEIESIVAGAGVTPPPPRQPPTDEEIKDVAASCMWWVREQDILDDAIELARAIEAAHGIKEKNHD